MLCDRCGTAIGTDSSTCVSCGADSFTRAKNEAAEKRSSATLVRVIILIVFGVIAIVAKLNTLYGP